MYKEYTTYERRYIIQYYGIQNAKEIALILGRTPASVYTAYNRFREDDELFEKESKAEKLTMKNAFAETVGRTNKNYTLAEQALIVQYASRGNGSDLARTLGRAEHSIRALRSRLRRNSKKWQLLNEMDVTEVAKWHGLI